MPGTSFLRGGAPANGTIAAGLVNPPAGLRLWNLLRRGKLLLKSMATPLRPCSQQACRMCPIRQAFFMELTMVWKLDLSSGRLSVE